MEDKLKKYNEINQRISSLMSFWGSHHVGEPIPSDMRIKLNSIRCLMIEFIKAYGITKDNNIYTYKVHKYPIYRPNVKFAYPSYYPEIYCKYMDGKNQRRKDISVKHMLYDAGEDKFIIRFPSSKNVLKKTVISIDKKSLEDSIYTHSDCKYYELLKFFSRVLYSHKFEEGLYVHVHGVNGTPDSVAII